MPGAGGGGGALKQPLLPDCGKKEGATTTTPHVAIKVERPSAVAEGVVPIVLETRALNYYLGAGEKGEEKRILKDVSLRFSSGVLTAVMGCVAWLSFLRAYLWNDRSIEWVWWWLGSRSID